MGEPNTAVSYARLQGDCDEESGIQIQSADEPQQAPPQRRMPHVLTQRPAARAGYARLGKDEGDSAEDAKQDSVVPAPEVVNQKHDRDQFSSCTAANECATTDPVLSEAGDDAHICIRVLTPQQQYHSVRIAPTACIAELKRQIALASKVDANAQRLIYLGKILRDDQIVSECELVNDAIVHLFPRSLPSQLDAQINPLTAAVTSGADPMRPSMTTPAHVPYMHEPIHFEPQILRCSREVKMWSLVLLVISFMQLGGVLSYLTSQSSLGATVLEQLLNVCEFVTSVVGLYTGSLGLRSANSLHLPTIKVYVRSMLALTVTAIFVRIIWVAYIIVEEKRLVAERRDAAQQEPTDDASQHEDINGYLDDTQTPLDPNIVVYAGVQAVIIALVSIAVWVTCAVRAVTFGQAVELYQAQERR